MQLDQLFSNTGIMIPSAWTSFTISGLCDDSRLALKNYVFFAMEGTCQKGTHYIDMAIEKGARVIVAESDPELLNQNVLYLKVSCIKSVMARAASVFNEVDFSHIHVIGVTGTNGKTSTVFHLKHLFESAGYKSAVISTICNQGGEFSEVSRLTTPSLLDIYRLLGVFSKQGCRYCFMEVSSHGILQQRIQGIPFKGKILTQVTSDHLDYHETIKNYEDTKESFFMNDSSYYVINNDDHIGKRILCMYKKDNKILMTYGVEESPLLAFGGLRVTEKQSVWTWIYRQNSYHAQVSFPVGDFMLYNFSAAVLVALNEGIEFEAILEGFKSLRPPKGRFSILRTHDFLIVIDYAHTSDALLKLLMAVRKFSRKRILVVFGCGGNRDKTKRREMGEIAAKWCDQIFLTSDNPRDENPLDIIFDIRQGISQIDCVREIEDRQLAIETALDSAKKDDVVVIAGKGHETYQEIKGHRNHFDDFEVTCNYLGHRLVS